jgi:hypothetical protein
MNPALIPLRLAEQDIAAGDVTEVMLFPIGEWSVQNPLLMAKYPDGLPLTQDTADQMVANFTAGVLGTDVQFTLSNGTHSSGGPAAFWLERIYCAPYEWNGRSGDALWASAKWTQAGAEAVSGDLFRYLSIEAGELETNDGERIDSWVLQGGVLTNHPLLKIMPPLKDAPQALAASEGKREPEYVVDLLKLADSEDPVAGLLDDMDTLAGKVDAALKGRKGMPLFRTMLSQARARIAEHSVEAAEPSSSVAVRDWLEWAIGELLGERVWVCDWSRDEGDPWVIYEVSSLDDPAQAYKATYTKTESGITLGQPVEVKRETTYVPASDGAPGAASPSDSQAVAFGEAGAGTGSAAGEESAAPKGAEHRMNSKALSILKLAEDASDDAQSAAVLALAEERDGAVKALADRDAADRQRDFEAKLAEAMKPDESGVVHILPAQKDLYLALAEIDQGKALEAIELAAKGPGLKLGAEGVGSEGDADEEKRPDIELGETALARASKDGITYAAAEKLILAENPELAKRYQAQRFNTGKEA